jgi:predicted phage terminase large subunit-like protein
MAALQYVDVPGYAALLLRRTYQDLALEGALMDRAASWLRGTDAQWSEVNKRWQFPSGATITFGYLANEQDKYRYQSAEFQFIGFDELTQFTESQYTYLFSRLRRNKTADVPLRMRAASNPGGVGHGWVRQRFIVEGFAKGRPFIPATLEDNEAIDRDEYDKALANLDPVTRLQLRTGNWDVTPDGALFQREWFRVVETAPSDMRRVRFWDKAATKPKPNTDPDWTAGALVGRSADGQFYICDIRRLRDTPLQVEKTIRQTAQMDGVGVSVYMEQEPGSSGVDTIDRYTREVLVGFAFYGVRSTGNKIERAQPVASQAEAGNVLLVRSPWVNDFLDEVTTFPLTGHDDQVDAVSGAVSELAGAVIQFYT